MMRKRILPLLMVAFAAVGANAQSPDSLYQPAMDLRVGGALESSVRTVAVLPGGSTRSTGSLREADFLIRAAEGLGFFTRYETGTLPPGVVGRADRGVSKSRRRGLNRRARRVARVGIPISLESPWLGNPQARPRAARRGVWPARGGDRRRVAGERCVPEDDQA